MAAFLTQSPAFAPMFQMPNAYKLATDVMKLRGMPAVNDYLTPPDKVPPPQPDPMAVQQMQNETMKAQAALITAQSTQGKVQANAQIDQAKVSLEEQKAIIDAQIKQRDAARKDLDIQNKVDVAQREMALEETMRPEEIKQTNIVSPNG